MRPRRRYRGHREDEAVDGTIEPETEPRNLVEPTREPAVEHVAGAGSEQHGRKRDRRQNRQQRHDARAYERQPVGDAEPPQGAAVWALEHAEVPVEHQR